MVKDTLFINWIYPHRIKDFGYENDLVKFAVEGIAVANQKREYAVLSYLDPLHCFVYSQETKHRQGFTNVEMESLLLVVPNDPELDMEKFNEAMVGNTCMKIDGDTINYHCDVLTALRCAIEGRKMNWWEMD
ncbi:hypothetical protein N9043_00130 [bacterium]|nr:hypothetical protein [bacterium]